MGIDRFEDLHSWQEARKLLRLVYALAEKPGLKSDYKLRDQSRAAAVSCNLRRQDRGRGRQSPT